MPLFPLIINGGDLISDTFNNKYRYTFPVGSIKFKGAKVAVASVNMYYSWFNISAANDNNTFQFTWYDVGATTYTLTFPDGFYDVDALNTYLQQYCITNGLYLIDASGDYVYYLEFAANSNYYSVQFNSYPIPTALPAGYSAPGTWPGYPAVASTPLLIVPSTNFRNVIGFNAGTYPTITQATNYSKLSDYTPQITPVQSLILTCSLLNNRYSNPGTVLYAFGPGGTTFGNLINSAPNQYSFVDIQEGSYSYFDIAFLDQDFNPVIINDTNLIVQLLVEDARDPY
jgi:hypothetical protein